MKELTKIEALRELNTLLELVVKEQGECLDFAGEAKNKKPAEEALLKGFMRQLEFSNRVNFTQRRIAEGAPFTTTWTDDGKLKTLAIDVVDHSFNFYMDVQDRVAYRNMAYQVEAEVDCEDDGV